MSTTPGKSLAALRHWEKACSEALDDLRGRRYTGHSEGDVVEVVVNGVGAIERIALGERALDYLSDEALSQHLVEAIGAARRATHEDVTAVAATRLGVDLGPPEVRSGEPGSASAAFASRRTVSTSAADGEDLCTVYANSAGEIEQVWLSDDACAADPRELAEMVSEAAGAAYRKAVRLLGGATQAAGAGQRA